MTDETINKKEKPEKKPKKKRPSKGMRKHIRRQKAKARKLKTD